MRKRSRLQLMCCALVCELGDLRFRSVGECGDKERKNRRTGCKKERTENLAKSEGLKSSAERIIRRGHNSKKSLNRVGI